MISTIAVLNNPISGALARADLEARGIPLSEVAVILIRPIRLDWFRDCARIVYYPTKPSNNLIGQRRFIGFYREAAKLLRDVERAQTLRDIYIVNNDNLLTSHLLHMARDEPSITVSIVGEGIMNFQRIERENRAGWRWRAKPLLAQALRLRYRTPQGHLSGAFEPEVDRVLSFAAEGLKAPPGKVEIIPFPKVTPVREADPGVALIALTGLAQWMEPDKVPPLADAFSAWVEGQGFRKILVKPHPHSPAGAIGGCLPPHEIIADRRSLEDMAADLEAATILGTCCTGLVTLKLMRPDLRCVDFGSDYYQVHAYGGDRSVETLLRAAGVEIVPMGGS